MTVSVLGDLLARSFAAMARKAEETSRTVLVPKQAEPEPPLAIHQLGASALRAPARRISKVDESVRELARDMLRSMYSAKGIGLAAPQVGVAKQLLVIDLDLEEASTPPLVLINPEITVAGGSCNTYEEGCLSIPGVYLQVVRPSVVEVSYRDAYGRPRRLKADGLLARCIQHELDHLNGVLFVDRVTDSLALNEELKQHGFTHQDVQPIR
jgi:peptide deformylase